MASLPPPVTADLQAPTLELLRQRAGQVMFDTYAGLPMLKFPEDLRVYEHIMWEQRVEVVLELGAQAGGSALWFRDRLRTLAAYGRVSNGRVISLDIDLAQARAGLPAADPGFADQITLVEGDVADAAVAEHIRELVPSGASCLVIEDLAHTYETDILRLGLDAPGLDTRAQWHSLLYAVLEGAADGLEINRTDIDGLVHSGADGRSGLVLFDTVPGGAGSVLRIAGALDTVIATAVRRVASCDCGPETSWSPTAITARTGSWRRRWPATSRSSFVSTTSGTPTSGPGDASGATIMS